MGVTCSTGSLSSLVLAPVVYQTWYWVSSDAEIFVSTKWANSQGSRIKAQALSESNDGSEPPIFKILFKKNPEINMCYTPKPDLPMSSSGALTMSTSPCCILLVDLSTRFPDSSHFCLYNISFNRIICLGT